MLKLTVMLELMVTTFNAEVLNLSIISKHSATITNRAKVTATTVIKKNGGALKLVPNEDKLIHRTTGMPKQI